jgi:hypothetical protein
MIFSFLKPRPETYEQRVIRFADTMVANADYLGKLNKNCLNPMPTADQMNMPADLFRIRQELIELQPIIDGDLEPYKKWMTKNYDDIKTHLLNNLYIEQPKADSQEWILNDVGKKMKQLKGHKNYQDYIDKKQKAEIAEMDGKIYWKRRALISALIGLILGIVISWIAIKLGLPTPMRSSQQEKQLSTPDTQFVKTDSTKH